MKEKRTSIPVESHSRKAIKVEASGLPTNFNVANVARLSFGHPENPNESGAETNSFGYALQGGLRRSQNLALSPMGKGKNLPVRLAPPVGRRFCNSQLNGNG